MFDDIMLYLWRVLTTTFLSFLLVFGLPLLLGFIQHFISKKNEQMGYAVMGRTAFQWLFARLGVPVHELGHALFALIFRHKITDIKLFKADSGDGCLGYVNHTFNKKSLYQRAGNFFIGIGPVLFGSLVLFVVSKLMFSYQMPQVAGGFENVWSNFGAILSGTKALLSAIFASGSVLKPVLFLYLVFAIGSNITLSASDLKGAGTGFWVLVGILLGANFLTLWLTELVPSLLASLAGVTAYMSLILGISIMLNLLFSVVLYVVKGLLNR
jgi:hypothetical protein